MKPGTINLDALDAESRAFYAEALTTLVERDCPFLLGGAYAFGCYTGIARHTKDLDVFIRRADAGPILAELAAAGFMTELTFPHWLGKARKGEYFIDLIFSSGNGVAVVDEAWFAHAVEGTLLGIPLKLIPAEEMIWSKAFVQERERYDGADVAHLLRARAEALDWRRLLDRFGANWRVLMSHLLLFGFAYPEERTKVPEWVMRELVGRLIPELAAVAPDGRVCRGTLISREQYLTDIGRWGYRDARLAPEGTMSPEEIAHWTAAIGS